MILVLTSRNSKYPEACFQYKIRVLFLISNKKWPHFFTMHSLGFKFNLTLQTPKITNLNIFTHTVQWTSKMSVRQRQAASHSWLCPMCPTVHWCCPRAEGVVRASHSNSHSHSHTHSSSNSREECGSLHAVLVCAGPPHLCWSYFYNAFGKPQKINVHFCQQQSLSGETEAFTFIILSQGITQATLQKETNIQK